MLRPIGVDPGFGPTLTLKVFGLLRGTPGSPEMVTLSEVVDETTTPP
jgi:hypothetical protein